MFPIPHLPLATDRTGPTNRSFWVVSRRFAAGAHPGKRERGSVLHNEVLEELLTTGIDSFMNLTQDRPGRTDTHLNRYDEAVRDRARVQRFEVPDLDIPTTEDMTRILGAIDADLGAGRSTSTAGAASDGPEPSSAAGWSVTVMRSPMTCWTC